MVANEFVAVVEFAPFPAVLGLMLALWIAGFDIIYSTQDEESDRALGLHSIPVRFGRSNALRIALACHIGVIAVAIALGLLFRLTWPWWTSVSLCAILLGYIHFLRRSDDLDQVNRDFFLANVAVSFLTMAGLGLHVFLKGGL